MKSYSLAALAILAGSPVTSAQYYRTEWQPCTFTNDDVRSGVDTRYLSQPDVDNFECSVVEAPLCHDGICDSNKVIELFVKRKVAKAKPADRKPQSVWVLNGGPGGPFPAMESMMTALYYDMNSTVNVYTTDHRGTGLSSHLDCGVPQATLTHDQYAACIERLLPAMDNDPIAFSTTSAALDLEYLITNLNAGEETYVYGGSYGTYWTTRLMHLEPTVVKGFILDGVVSESGPVHFGKYSFTYWNENRRGPSGLFFEYCAKSPDCPLKFNGTANAHQQILQQINELDKNPNACTRDDEDPTSKPSVLLRNVVARLRQDSREVIPYVLSLFLKCDTEAQLLIPRIMSALSPTPIVEESALDALKAFAKADKETQEEDVTTAMNMMLRYLIGFSELWSNPTPSLEQIDQEFMNGVIVDDGKPEALLACIFMTDDQEPAFCKNSDIPATKAFQYPVNKYWNKTAKIPKGTSVLFLNGKLDFATPAEFGDIEFKNMQGDAKLSVSFDYGDHMVACTLNTQFCAVGIISNYLRAHGDTTKVDTSCVAKTPAIDFSAKKFRDALLNATTSAPTTKPTPAPTPTSPVPTGTSIPMTTPPRQKC